MRLPSFDFGACALWLLRTFQQERDEQRQHCVGGRTLLFGVVDDRRDVEALRHSVLQQPVSIEADRKPLSAIVAAPLRKQIAVGGEGPDERVTLLLCSRKSAIVSQAIEGEAMNVKQARRRPRLSKA